VNSMNVLSYSVTCSKFDFFTYRYVSVVYVMSYLEILTDI
jgi:hypothetical protein